MIQNTKFIHQSSPTLLSHRQHTLNLKPTHIPLNQNIPTTNTSISPPILKQCNSIKPSKFTRRELTLFTNSSLLLLFTSQTLDLGTLSRARAEETPPENTDSTLEETLAQNTDAITEQTPAENVSTEETPAEETEETPAENVKTEETPAEKTDEIAAENAKTEDDAKAAFDRCNDKPITGKAFLDVSIDGNPAGRIIIGLHGNTAPIGAARFRDIVSGKAGITYRRKEFTRIMPNYVQHGGIRSYGVDAELARRKKGKELTNEELIDEWERLNEECNSGTTKNVAWSVSLIVRDPLKPPPKAKLVARGGRLEIDQEEVGVEPNGTEFAITVKDSPELDASGLVVGKVIQGMDVVERIAQVKTVNDNTTSPYFRVAKLIGDKRAVVAERGFNRPYSKVLVTNCGMLE